MAGDICVSCLPMPEILHIIDANAGWDMLRQLSTITLPRETIASLGVAALEPSLQGRVVAVHRPLGLDALASPQKTLAHADVVHVWSITALDAADSWACHYQCPLVLSLPCLPQQKKVKKLLEYFPRRAEGRHLPGKKFTITVPDQPTLDAMLKAGFPNESLRLLPPPQDDISNRPANREKVRAELELAATDILLLGGGEMVRQAGQKFAIWAHAILRQVIPNIRLILPGGGNHADSVKYFAGTTGYDSEIYFTQNRYTFEEVLAASDIATFLFDSDCGLAALAGAMQAGLPIVASEVPQIKYTLSCTDVPGGTGYCGLLVPPEIPRQGAAAVLELIEKPRLAGKLGQAAKQNAARLFSRQKSRQILDSIYCGRLIETLIGAN